MIDSMLKTIRHYRGTTVAVIICIGLLVWVYGCESTVSSFDDSTVKFTRSELAVAYDLRAKRLVVDTKQQVGALQAQIDAVLSEAELSGDEMVAQYEAKNANLDRQDAVKKAVLEGGLAYAEGTVNPIGVLFMLAGILGGGAMVDNYRKDGLLTTPEAVEVKNKTT